MKLIYLFETRITQNFIFRYGVDYFINNNYQVFLFDVSYIVDKNLSTQKIDKKLYHKYNIFDLQNHKEFLSRIKELKIFDAYVILKIPYNYKTLKFFKIFKKRKLKYIFLANDLLPQRSFNERNSQSSLKIKSYYIFNSIFARIPYFLFNINPASLVIFSGEDNRKKFIETNPISKKTVTHNMHPTNFEVFFRKDIKKRIIKQEYVLFIDQFIPNHPENLTRGIQFDSNEYYSEINHFLKKIERLTHCKVVIAAHPKSNYQTTSNPYFFDVYHNKTQELIINAKFVLLHNSTVINLIVYLEKDFLIFLTSEMIEKSNNHWALSREIALQFGKNILNISKFDCENFTEDDLKKYLHHSLEKNNNYKKKYITTNEKGLTESIYDYILRFMSSKEWLYEI